MPLHGDWQQASSLSQEGLTGLYRGTRDLKRGVTSSQLSPSSPASDGKLLAKWKKQGYENLYCLWCIQTWDTNFGTNSFAKSPKAS